MLAAAGGLGVHLQLGVAVSLPWKLLHQTLHLPRCSSAQHFEFGNLFTADCCQFSVSATMGWIHHFMPSTCFSKVHFKD